MSWKAPSKLRDKITVLGEASVIMTGTVDEVRSNQDTRIQNMLNRKPREESIDADEYLRRLTRRSV